MRRDARVEEVETTVDNQIAEHRLRMLFPTAATWPKFAWLTRHLISWNAQLC